MAVSAWLIFLIVREQTAWRPAAWLGAGLFLAVMEIHRFYGGFPRAFVHPVVLLTVLLAMRNRQLAAALVAASGALLYPPAALLAVGVLCVSALEWRRIDWRRARFAALSLGLAAAAVLVPRLASGGAAARDDGGRGAAVPGVRPRRGAALLRALGRRVPEPEPERVRPADLGQHPRRRRAGAAAPAAREPAAAAARGARDAGRRPVRLRALAGRPVQALPAAPLHVSADRVLRDRRRGLARADVAGRSTRGGACARSRCSPRRSRCACSRSTCSRWRRSSRRGRSRPRRCSRSPRSPSWWPRRSPSRSRGHRRGSGRR